MDGDLSNKPAYSPFRVAVALAVVILLVGGLVFSGWALWHNFHHKTVSNSQTASNPSKPAPVTTPAAPNTPITPAPPANPSPAPATTNTSPAQSNLSNTGPGNVIAIFLLTTILASLGHHLFLRRNI